MDNKFYTFTQYMKNTKELTPSAEDYIEMIYRLSLKDGYTRVNELASAINVKPPSVTKMLKKLNNLSLVEYNRYGPITLTSSGKSLGYFLINRHNTIHSFLELLSIKEDKLEEVEKIEHTVNASVLNGINLLVSFFNDNPNIKTKLDKYMLDNINN